MALIPGSVRVGGFIAPSDSADTYPTHDDLYGKGGYKVVADITARDAITADRRKEGMLVRVLDAGGGSPAFYTLSGGITNGDWVVPDFGGGSGGISVQNLTFYPGNVSPLAVDTDVYAIRDSAGFEAGVDEDVVFSLTQIDTTYVSDGFKLFFNYAMETSEVGKNIRLKLDYIVHEKGETVAGGTPYTSTVTVPVNETADELDSVNVFTIAGGVVSADTEEVEFRLTRLGTDVLDTHNGLFGLKDILVKPNI